MTDIDVDMTSRAPARPRPRAASKNLVSLPHTCRQEHGDRVAVVLALLQLTDSGSPHTLYPHVPRLMS
jgi:hypothetical protein